MNCDIAIGEINMLSLINITNSVQPKGHKLRMDRINKIIATSTICHFYCIFFLTLFNPVGYIRSPC